MTSKLLLQQVLSRQKHEHDLAQAYYISKQQEAGWDTADVEYGLRTVQMWRREMKLTQRAIEKHKDNKPRKPVFGEKL